MKKNTRHIPDREQFKALLKDADMKATAQRLAVHDAMTALEHASADTVAEYLKDKGDTGITVSSVYNILSKMADLKIYARRLSGSNKMFFDVDPSRHIHLYDTRFNEYRNIPDNDVLSIIESRFKGRKFKGYKIDGIDVQIICHSTVRGGRKQR